MLFVKMQHSAFVKIRPESFKDVMAPDWITFHFRCFVYKISSQFLRFLPIVLAMEARFDLVEKRLAGNVQQQGLSHRSSFVIGRIITS